jgi:hypothetical protein
MQNMIEALVSVVVLSVETKVVKMERIIQIWI